jgi:hypothetical protein
MSIIILLISLLVPALNRVRRYAQGVKQKAQFHAITIALDLFSAENEGYPDSNENDDLGLPYCGAMKLCEAMAGQDLKGFNQRSRFRREAFARPNVAGITLYPDQVDWPTAVEYAENIKSRKMYLQLENANAYLIKDIYDAAGITSANFDPCTFVLCDVYNRVTNKSTGKKIGMPILYYKAHTTNTQHAYNGSATTSEQVNIYDSWDNQSIVELGLPWMPGRSHSIALPTDPPTPGGATPNPQIFYDKTRNNNIPGGDRPYREDSYILLSAGFDGEYGTSDDIFNFGE